MSSTSIPLRPSQAPSTSSRQEGDLPQETPTRLEKLSTDEEYEDMGPASASETANISYLNRVRIPIEDTYTTDTSTVQDDTYDVIAPFLEGNPFEFLLNAAGLPKLQRDIHAKFVKKAIGDYPAPFAQMDSSRPWLVYWNLQSMTAMGLDISQYQERVAHTFTLCQHPTGGYGGGFGQLPHLAGSYAAVLSLSMAGGTAAYESIDRRSMWQFLGRMKAADGGFTMCPGGEEDIRGAFCALVICSLLNLPMELPPDAPARAHGLTTFTSGLGEWISQCQSWDGGISATPGNEAHGAYAFCGLGCLAILGAPNETLPTYLDVQLLTHWLSSRQCSPEGGYNGRTNKLVDGCYSHWIGGCWAIVEAATTITPPQQCDTESAPSLWNREALARYILSACQDRKGGLKDKPGKYPDAYHTCYNIVGLSAAQHRYVYDPEVNKALGKSGLGAPYHWKTVGLWESEEDKRVWDEGDVVRSVHPVFIIPYMSVYETRRYFEEKGGL